MTQVIVYTNGNGNVSVCYPTGEIPIEEVLVKDCPEGAIIIDASDLPQGEDDFFDAWRLTLGKVFVNLGAAKDIQTARFNAMAKEAVSQRSMNTAIGISNEVSDADFIADLNAKRTTIMNATSTNELRAVKV